MPPARWGVMVLPLALLAAGVIHPAAAQQADDRCTGTLCDLYYGARPAAPAAPSGAPAPTPSAPGFLGTLLSGGAAPATPNAPAPAQRPLVAIQGGGLISAAKGAPDEPCTGTLCDLYYGTSTPWPEDKPAPPAPAATLAAEPASDALPPETSEPPVEFTDRPEPAHCIGTAADPWRCFRK